MNEKWWNLLLDSKIENSDTKSKPLILFDEKLRKEPIKSVP